MWNLLIHIVHGNTTTRKRARSPSDEVWSPRSTKTDIQRDVRRNVRKRCDKENTPPASDPVHIVSRRRSSNALKLRLIVLYEQMRLDNMWLSVDEVQDRFHRANPGTPVNTLKKWLVSREVILSDGLNSSPLRVRTSQVSAERLGKYKVGQFEETEITLYNEIVSRHQEGLMTSSVWVMARMKQLLHGNPLAHKCTRGWLNGFYSRLRLSSRKASNTHAETVVQRNDDFI